MSLGFPAPCCVSHTEEHVFCFCKDCNKLLCHKCIMESGNHGEGHSRLSYSQYIKSSVNEVTRQAEEIQSIISRAKNLASRVEKLGKRHESVVKESESSVDELEAVKVEITTWRDKMVDKIDARKEKEIQKVKAGKHGEVKIPKTEREALWEVHISDECESLKPMFMLKNKQAENPYSEVKHYSIVELPASNNPNHGIPDQLPPPLPSNHPNASRDETYISVNIKPVHSWYDRYAKEPFSCVCVTKEGYIMISGSSSCLEIHIVILTRAEENKYKSETLIVPLKEKLRSMSYSCKENAIYGVFSAGKHTTVKKFKIGVDLNAKRASIKFLSALALQKGMIPMFVAAVNDSNNDASSYLIEWSTTGESKKITAFDYRGKSMKNVKADSSTESKLFQTGLDYRDGYLSYADARMKNVTKISVHDERLVWNESVDARKKGIVSQPMGVSILPNQSVAVADTGKKCVLLFSSEGKCTHRLNCQDAGNEAFNELWAIAIRRDEELLVLDSLNCCSRLQIFYLRSLDV